MTNLEYVTIGAGQIVPVEDVVINGNTVTPTLDPPLPPSVWNDHWTKTAEANGFIRVRQGKTGPPDTPSETL